MAREVFDWSALDRSTLYSILNEARKRIVGQKLSIEEIHKILAKQIKKHLPIRVKLARSAEQEHGIIYIGGCYYADDDEEYEDKCIEIIFSYFVWDQHLKITSWRWARMCELFADTMLHEIIHMRQYRTRNFKTLPGYESTAYSAQQRRNQNYYGHPDEIGAYAFNIACELYEHFGSNKKAIQKFMDGNQSNRHRRSTFLRYVKTFGQDHPVMKRLKRKVIYYLPYAKLGKPFKTSDYLTY